MRQINKQTDQVRTKDHERKRERTLKQSKRAEWNGAKLAEQRYVLSDGHALLCVPNCPHAPTMRDQLYYHRVWRGALLLLLRAEATECHHIQRCLSPCLCVLAWLS